LLLGLFTADLAAVVQLAGLLLRVVKAWRAFLF
jgi:hypothetical protein